MKSLFALLAVAPIICHAGFDDCEKKYSVDLPAGATPPQMARPSRIGPPLDMKPGYACALLTINEAGDVTEAELVETNSPSVGEYVVTMAKGTKYRPAMRDGKPITHKTVIRLSFL